MNMAKVVAIGDVRVITTKFGDKEKCTVTLTEMSTGKEYKCGYFLGKDGINFAVGDEVFCEISENNGYLNVKNISKPDVPKIEVKPVPEAVDKVVEDRNKVFAEKEKRDFGGRGIAYGLTFVDLMLKHGWYEVDKGNLSRDEMWVEVLKYADWAKEHVYKNEESAHDESFNPFEKEDKVSI